MQNAGAAEGDRVDVPPPLAQDLGGVLPRHAAPRLHRHRQHGKGQGIWTGQIGLVQQGNKLLKVKTGLTNSMTRPVSSFPYHGCQMAIAKFLD